MGRAGAGQRGREAHFVGVYDGHGGKEAAEFVGEKLHVNLQAALPKTWDYQAALYEAFLTTDEQLIATDEPSGTCAVVAVLHESVLSKTIRHGETPPAHADASGCLHSGFGGPGSRAF